MDIRPIRADEVPVLIDDLWLPFADEMRGIDERDSLAEEVDVRTEAIDYRRAQLDDEDVQTFVAVEDGVLAGYTTVTYSEGPSVFARGPRAKIKDLYVAPENRGAGFGTELLERAHEWGRERDCESAALTVHARNETARQCYEAMDYETRYVKMDRPL
ncbi:GNAT family N-acetyltransferase [Haloferax sp. DFSO60]|uniref:GNAT family N-acetyltransferase n=1 Tax=Haloferax sp. DFSO60 TaxID=3388652 RepID=UPI00397D583D